MKLGKLEVEHFATLRAPSRKKFGWGCLGGAEWVFSTASLDEMTDDTLRAEMSLLFAEFLPATLSARFAALLQMKPARWGKIEPWSIWRCIDAKRIVEINQSLDSLLKSSQLSAYTKSQATVLRCGHEKPSIERLVLEEALLGESAVFEGFVSILPKKLGLVINHDGGLCLLQQ